MKRYLVLVGLLCAALVVVGCETKATKPARGPDLKKDEPAATPTTPEPKKASADLPADPFASQPAPQPSLGIPKIEPPKNLAPATEPEKKAEAKK